MDTLRHVKYMFDAADVDPSIPRYMAISAFRSSRSPQKHADHQLGLQLRRRLSCRGEIDTFMGFKFIRIERLLLVDATYDTSAGAVDSGGGSLSNARRCLAWCGDGGVVLAISRDMEPRSTSARTRTTRRKCSLA